MSVWSSTVTGYTRTGAVAGSVTTAIPPRCPTRTRLYRSGRLVAEGFPAERIREHLDAYADAVVWLDLDDPDTADLGIVIEEFDLHPLAVEDAIQDHQRPKLDHYPTHLFVNVYAVAVEPELDLRVTELSAFITPRALLARRRKSLPSF